jgi:hypothetical protein
MSDNSIRASTEIPVDMVKKTSIALRQCQRALDNLRSVGEWAGRHGSEGLEAGACDLRSRLEFVTADLRSLLGILRAQLAVQGIGKGDLCV